MPVIAEVYIGTRIPAILNARLTRIAEREHNGVSAVVRRLLSAALEREDVAPVRRARPRKRTRRA